MRAWAMALGVAASWALGLAQAVAEPARVPRPEASPNADPQFGLSGLRQQRIERRKGEEWPFTVDSGTLFCVRTQGLRVAWLVEDGPVGTARMVPLDANPFVTFFVSDEERSLLREYPTYIEGYEARGPFVELAHLLCDGDTL